MAQKRLLKGRIKNDRKEPWVDTNFKDQVKDNALAKERVAKGEQKPGSFFASWETKGIVYVLRKE